MTLVLAESELTKRRQNLKRTFRPITPNGKVETFFRATASGVITGLGRELIGNDLRSVRHPSRVANIYINYFEVWQLDREDRFNLDKAYFHLDATLHASQLSEEIIAIHCDALAKEGEVAFIYKRGPHLHVSGNKRDFSKAHIALCLGELDAVCSDMGKYSNNFSAIIKMVGDEILPQLARA